MTSRKAEFLNIIKPILDRSQVDKDAENLAVELQDKLGKFKVGLDESGLKEFEEVFNKEMVALGKQPIVLSNISIGDNTIRDMAKQIARGVAGVVGNEISKGVKTSVDDAMAEIARLEKSKKPYHEERKKVAGRKAILSSTIAAREDKTYIHPHQMAKEKDINEQAKKIYQEFQDAKNALKNLYEDVSVSDADYQKAEDRFYESVDNLYRMRQTIKNHMDEMTDKSIKKKFKFDNLNSAVDEAFSEVELPSLDDSDGKLAEYEIKLDAIDKTLASIDSRIQEIKNNNKEIINEEAVNKALKTLEEVEDAYNRISKKTNKKEADSRKLNRINSAIDYDPTAENNKNILNTLQAGLNHARQSGAGWEEEYQWIVKFVKQYKYLQENGQLSAHLQKQYEPLFNELVGMAENAESSLRTLVDRATGVTQGVSNKLVTNVREDITTAKTDSDNIRIILEDMNKFLSSNKDKKIKDYFKLIASGAYEMSDDVKAAIEATIGSLSLLNSIDIGANNHGGLIGDKNALILRKPAFDRDKQKWDTDKQNDGAIALQNRLSNTNISDINLGKIQEVIKTEEYLVELQNRVSGAPISTIGEAIEGINPEILNTTVTAVQSLIQAMRKLYNIGVEVDVQNLGNILYDGKNNQFGIVDMDVKHDFESFEEMLKAFAQTVRNQVEDIANVLNDPKMAQAWSQFADMVDDEIRKIRIPSEEDIKAGKASWRDMPIKYNASLPNEAQNLTDYMEVGPKFFEAQNQDGILDHEVAHNIADRLMKYAAGEWEKATDIFMSNGEGLYGDLGASALSETLAHAVTEYFSNPDVLKARSEGAFNYIEEYLKKSGDTLDNVYSKLGEAPVEQQSDGAVADNEKKIKSYEELKNVLQEYYDAVINIKKAEGVEQKQPHVEKYMDFNNLLLDQLEDDSQKSQLMGKLKNVSEVGVDDESVKSIANILGVEIPQAVEKVETAITELNKTEQQPDTIVADNIKKIESYEELKQALQEYYNTLAQVKTLEHTDEDAKWIALENVDLPNDFDKTSMEDYFKMQWSRVATIKKSQKLGADSYIDPEYKTAIRIGENTLEEETKKLKAMAATWVMDLDKFSDTQKKFINNIGPKYDAWFQNQFNKLNVLDEQNKPHTDKAFNIEKLISKQLKNPKDMKDYSSFTRALNEVENYGVTEQSLRVICNLIGIEIPQAADTAKQSVDELTASLEKQQQVKKADNSSAEVAETNAETEAIKKKTEAVRNLQALVDNPPDGHGKTLADPSKTTSGSGDVGIGVNTEELQKILTNTYKVQIVQKHDAPDSEKKAALIDIEALKAALGQVTYNTKIVKDDNDKTANKIALDDSSLEVTLNRVFANILNPTTQQNDGQIQESWALESTLQTVKGVLEKINNKIVQGTKVIKTGDKKAEEKKSSKPEIKKATDDGYVKATKVDTRVKELQGLYEKQGILEAQLEHDSKDAKVKELLKQNEEDILKLKKEGVTVDEQELANLKEKAKQRKADVLNAEKANEARKKAAQDKKAELRARIKRDKEENRVNTSTSAWNAGNKALESLWKIDDSVVWDPNSEDDKSKLEPVNKLKDALTELNTVRQRINDNLRKGIEISETDSNELSDKTEQVAIHTEAVKKLISNYTALSGANVKETGRVIDPNADLETQLVNATKALTNGQARIGDFDAATGRLKYTVKTGAYTFQEYEMAVREAGGAIVSVQGATKRTETFLEGFKRKFSEITRYFSASSLMFKAVNEVRKGIQYIRDIDSALTELKKVTDETEETYDKFLDTASKTAAKVGSTIKDVVSSTADFARLGYSLEQAAVFAESAQILMNVSEFTDISRATDTLISAVQAFGYTAETSMEVVDLLNMIGKIIAYR